MALKQLENKSFPISQIQARVLCTELPIHCWLTRWDYCRGAGGGLGTHLGEGAVVTTTVETDFGEPVAMCCWSGCAGTVWMRT